MRDESAALRKELGLRDLVLQQIVYVVGTVWVGTAAKLGPSQVIFWLAAILLFYLPQAAVVVDLTRRMPLEGGLYQWARLSLGELMGFLVAWNLWLYAVVFIATIGLLVGTNLSYVAGPPGAWMASDKTFVMSLNALLLTGLVVLAPVGGARPLVADDQVVVGVLQEAAGGVGELLRRCGDGHGVGLLGSVTASGRP
jgi:amino acid transporter